MPHIFLLMQIVRKSVLRSTKNLTKQGPNSGTRLFNALRVLAVRCSFFIRNENACWQSLVSVLSWQLLFEKLTMRAQGVKVLNTTFPSFSKQSDVRRNVKYYPSGSDCPLLRVLPPFARFCRPCFKNLYWELDWQSLRSLNTSSCIRKNELS